MGVGTWSQKIYDEATGPRKKFVNIFSCQDIIHERDGQTSAKTVLTHSVARLGVKATNSKAKARGVKAKAKALTSKAKDLASKAKDLTAKAKDLALTHL